MVKCYVLFEVRTTDINIVIWGPTSSNSKRSQTNQATPSTFTYDTVSSLGAYYEEHTIIQFSDLSI
jgi:hypothetical protein